MAVDFFVKLVFLTLGTFTLVVFSDNAGHCTDGTGQERKNGTVWSPDVAGETNPCITCTCLNGRITCEREICPKLQCANSKSYPVAGKCCKTCDKPRNKGGVCKKDRKRRKKTRKNRRKNRRRNRKGRSKRKDGRRNKKKNRRRQRKKSKNCIRVQHNVTVADKQCPSIQPTYGALPCHYNNMCLPAKTEFIIYRFIIRGDKKADDSLIIAFDNVKTHLVEIWKYVLSKDKIKQRQELNKCASSSFRRQVKSSKAILGAASVKSVKDFQRKLRRGLKGCEKKKKGCRLRTVRRQMVCFDLEDIDVVKCKN